RLTRAFRPLSRRRGARAEILLFANRPGGLDPATAHRTARPCGRGGAGWRSRPRGARGRRTRFGRRARRADRPVAAGAVARRRRRATARARALRSIAVATLPATGSGALRSVAIATLPTAGTARGLGGAIVGTGGVMAGRRGRPAAGPGALRPVAVMSLPTAGASRADGRVA